MKPKNISLQVRQPHKHEHEALKNLSKGVATDYQQKAALKYIVEALCRTHDLLYIPNSFDETAFINGRAFVGQNITRILKQPIGKYDTEAENNV